MMEPRIDINDIDKAGRVITVKDITGVYNANTNPGGYGGPNVTKSQIQGVVITLSHYDSDEVWQVRYVRVADPLHPEYLTVPSVSEILNGAVVQLTSITLGIDEPTEGIKSFNDGLLDLNYYPYTALIPASGTAGQPFVTGSGLDAVYELPSVLIGDKVYTIDHSMDTNGGTVLYFIEDLEEDTTALNPAYRANTKVFMNRLSQCVLTKMSAKLASILCGGCRGGDCEQLKKKLLTIKHNRDAAVLDFYDEDYNGANKKLTYAAKLGNTLGCGC